MKMGNKIASQRKELGMTQQQLADKLYVSVKTVSKWETNRGNPEINILPKLSKILGMDIADLFGDINNEDFIPDTKREFDIMYAIFNFGFGFLGLIFFALTFLKIRANSPWDSFFDSTSVEYLISGYQVLFKLTAERFSGFLLIFTTWIAFLIIFAYIGLGVIEIVVKDEVIIKQKNKASFIISIIGIIAIIITIINSIDSPIRPGFGVIMVFLLFVFTLGYNIYYRKQVELKD